MSCPIANMWVRLPLMNEECRNSLIIRLIQKRNKLNKLRLSLAQTSRQDVGSRASLSEAIILTCGSICELKLLLARTQSEQYKLQPAGPYVVHSCPNRPIEIDLTDSNQEIEIIGYKIGNNSPSL